MDLIKRVDIPEKQLLGRHMWKVMGDDAPYSDDVSTGFARFSLANGPMIPHKHEREIIYVIDAKGTCARFGNSKDGMNTETKLEPGDLLRFHDGEWHIFEMDDEESYLDIFWVFSVPQNTVVE